MALAAVEQDTDNLSFIRREKYSGKLNQQWSLVMVNPGSGPYYQPDPGEPTSTVYIPQRKK
jgi:hypothetical protein